MACRHSDPEDMKRCRCKCHHPEVGCEHKHIESNMTPEHCADCGKLTHDHIRTSLTYSLPAGLTDSEWEVIINCVEMLIEEGWKAGISFSLEIVKNNHSSKTRKLLTQELK